jgi:hypothetical protein
MRSKTMLRTLVGIVLLASGCSTASLQEGAPDRASAIGSSLQDVVFAETEGDLSVVAPRDGARALVARSGIASPNFSYVYSLSRREGAPVVTAHDAVSGRGLHRAAAPAGLELRVASVSGKLVALSEPHEPGATPWLPAGRTHTRVAVISTSNESKTRRYNLKGNFELEAFSTDDQQLFLIEYMPSMNPTHYRLRRLVLESGRVKDIARPLQKAPERMNGTGRAQIFSPTGHELYTLYTQQGPNYAHGAAADTGETYAFVHLLNLDGAWTHCIDLPMPFGTGAVTTHALAVSADGDRLYVADPSSGGLAAIAPKELRVVKSATINLRALTAGRASASVASGGTLYLGGGAQILAIDGESLEVIDRRRLSNRVLGLEVSSDGRRLYVAHPNELSVLDAATGVELRSIAVPGIRRLQHTGRGTT